MRQNDLIDILLVSSDFVFGSTDNSGKILTVTPACREVLKLQEGEIEGKLLNEVIPELAFHPQSEYKPVQPRGGLDMWSDDVIEEGADYMEFLAYHTQEQGRFEIETAIDSTPAWLSLVTNKVQSDDDIIFTVLIRDISPRKRDEKEILDLNQNLEQRVESRTEQIKSVVMSCSTELGQVNDTYQSMKEKQMDIMESMESQILAVTEDWEEEQQEKITQVIQAQLVKCMNLYSEDQITDQKFLLTMMSLNELFGSESDQNENLKPGQLGGTNQDEVDDLMASLGI